jgi:phosphatidylinositol-3-phosphatase
MSKHRDARSTVPAGRAHDRSDVGVRCAPRRPALAACALAALLAAAIAGTGNTATRTQLAGTRRPPAFDRVVLVVFENKEYDQVLRSPEAPTFGSLARRYALLENYHGVAHPSLPNYLALVSGSTQGITSDCTSCQVRAPNLADTLEQAGRTWKVYAEGLPRPGFVGSSAGRYAKKHNPLVYFTDVAASRDRLRRVVPLSTFRRDLEGGSLPDFALVVPDLCHDMHDCSIATGDRFLRTWVPRITPALGTNGIIITLFDEGYTSEGCCHGRAAGGHIAGIISGPGAGVGVSIRTRVNQYSILRLIEDAWGLGALG